MATDAGKIRIWNMALGFIGTRTIAAEEEKCAEAIQCGLYWDAARRQALRDYPYNFAQRRAWLAEVDLPDTYAVDWQHAYALPDACVKVQGLRPVQQSLPLPSACGAAPLDLPRIPFALSANDAGRELLLCDVAPALLVYTADVSDTSKFDDLFTGMLARKLASMIAIPLLKNNSSKISELVQLYNASVPDATRANASERKDRPAEDAWLIVR